MNFLMYAVRIAADVVEKRRKHICDEQRNPIMLLLTYMKCQV